MNSNELMFYLKGHFELSNEPPTREQWAKIRSRVLEAFPIQTTESQVLLPGEPPPLPTWLLRPPKAGDCGCGGTTPAEQSRVEGG